MSHLPPCPEDVKKRGMFLHRNSLVGFQAPGEGGGPNIFVICFIFHEFSDEQVARINAKCGTKTLEADSWIGRDYLKIHWTEYSKIPDILTELLQTGESFQTMSTSLPKFDSNIHKKYTRELHEQICINRMQESLDQDLKYYKKIHFGFDRVNEVYFDPWNYITEEGKDFCKKLRALKGLPQIDNLDTHPENYFKWPIFQNYDPVTLMSIEVRHSPSSAIAAAAAPDVPLPTPGEPVAKVVESAECMVCMDAIADTMVMPCEHVVVCKSCSVGLQKTADHHTCIKCRRSISHILD